MFKRGLVSVESFVCCERRVHYKWKEKLERLERQNKRHAGKKRERGNLDVKRWKSAPIWCDEIIEGCEVTIGVHCMLYG